MVREKFEKIQGILKMMACGHPVLAIGKKFDNVQKRGKWIKIVVEV